ncbi:UDP-N-acetylmuramate--L-alanine ligase [Patescibacteria group bacterium]|nr:UDP-N-acetylmuramate--L-alanine ligase [Patescibacteria group bacterium]
MENKKQKIHFIGIGGIGVSALARYFLARGDTVSGSDAAESEIVENLRGLGVKIYTPANHLTILGDNSPQLPLNLRGREDSKSPTASLLQSGEKIDLVIYSAAVREDNPELMEAWRLGIKTQKYAEALGDLTKKMYTIAVSGMHGKSTTTAMIGLIMEKAGLNPTVIVGTKVEWNNVSALNNGIAASSTPPRNDTMSYGNFRFGKSKYLVIEADEYDRSFLNYWPKVLVMLNIEEEHLDTYIGGLPDIMKTFREYVGHLSGEGVLVANEEDKNVAVLLNPKSEFLISKQIQNSKFKIQKYNSELGSRGLKLKIPGQHNLSNANAALAVARVLGIDEKIAIGALNDFSGTWRRMEYKGELNGAKVYDDYAHHPTEIKATLAGARELLKKSHCEAVGRRKVAWRPRRFTRSNPADGSEITGSPRPCGARDDQGRLWCVFQPHQYQRTYKLFEQFTESFADADKAIILPIYSVAGREKESIKKKVSSERLVKALRQAQGKQKEILYMDDFDKVAEYLRENLDAGDICVIMGAGDIYKLTNQLLIK